jgi:hypothetical protein
LTTEDGKSCKNIQNFTFAFRAVRLGFLPRPRELSGKAAMEDGVSMCNAAQPAQPQPTSRSVWSAPYPGALALFKDFGRRKHIEKRWNTVHSTRFARLGVHSPPLM